MLLNGVRVTRSYAATTTHSTTDRNHTQGRAHQHHARRTALAAVAQSHPIIPGPTDPNFMSYPHDANRRHGITQDASAPRLGRALERLT